jgi:CheY-like chemotaxis protein
MKADKPKAYFLCDDMIFTSRVASAGGASGVEVKMARSSEALEALLGQEIPDCIIVDLGNPGLDIDGLAQRIRARDLKVRMVAYGSHVDTETLNRARESGYDPVVPRSKFVEVLPEALAEWAKREAP